MKASMLKAMRALLLAWLLSSVTGYAHQDRIITLKEDGSLVGLPAVQSPAKLEITFVRKDIFKPPISSITLTLREHRVEIPLCVTGLILTESRREVKVTASWHYSDPTEDGQLNVTFYDPGYKKSRWVNGGYSLHFNLRTGLLNYMQVIVVRSPDSEQYLALDTKYNCSDDEYRSFVNILPDR